MTDEKKQDWFRKIHNKYLTKQKIVIGLAIAGAIAIPILYNASWSGFGPDSNISDTTKEVINPRTGEKIKLTETTVHHQSAKTFWDWLGLGGTLAIPFVLYQFQRSESEQADNTSREEALLSYFKHISELLIDKKLKLLINHNQTIKEGLKDQKCLMLDALLDSVRACTLSILRRMDKDGERKGRVISFLSDAELISELNLELADLSDAKLSNVILNNAKLCYAKLRNADLRLTDERIINKIKRVFCSPEPLFKAMKNKSMITEQQEAFKFIDNKIQLRCANLENACLCNRFLPNANLQYANLSNADLSNADLSNADLSNA
ncbi:pentapeptide repeat-containing protein, partial [Nostoc sp. PCC 9305]|uniref:pentapeptide repeat-containing protein n=1 Tax=Nostoc sp. PCC 9305 TaxID=296636 RepID=UPI0039C6C263